MNVIIFAGGAGTRLWPLSRKATPKQFERFFHGKSTLELAIERVRSFGMDNIYVSTNKNYVDIVADQIPDLDRTHIFSEPAKRDLAAAIGLTLLRLKKQGVSGTVAMIWSDHLMDRPEAFVDALKKADALVKENAQRMIFIGEQPRFANQNLGWIQTGEQIGEHHHAFLGWHYRPELDRCEEMFASGEWLWNPGYFVYDIDFVLELYKTHQPALFEALSAMVEDEALLQEAYEQLDAVSFDNAIAEKLKPEQAVVLPVDMGWSDPGTLYAMKEALASSQEDNVEQGHVVTQQSQDCFVYNEEDSKIVTTVGLNGVVVVNTKDSLLVCHKNAVPQIKTLLKRIEQDGLGKYL